MTITTKITLTIALAVAFLLAVVFLLCQQIDAISDDYDHILATQVREQDQARVMQVTFKKQVQAWKNVLLRPDEFQKYRDEFFQEEKAVQKAAHALREEVTQPEVRAQLDEFIRLHEKAGAAYREGLEILMHHGRLEPRANDAVNTVVKGVDRKPTDVIDQVVELLGEEVATHKERQKETARREWQVLGAGSVVVALLVLGAGVVVTRRITTRLYRTMDVLEAVARGDLTRQVEVTSADEVGRMAAALNTAVAQMRQAAEEKELNRREAEQRAERERQQEHEHAERARQQAERERQQERERAEEQRRQAEELRARVDGLLQVVKAAADGDLTWDVATQGDDPVGQMGEEFAAFLGTLRTIIASIAQNAEGLAGASEELSAMSRQMSSNADATSVQAGVVSAASEQVSRNVQTVATGTEEMSASIREIAKNASEAARVARSAVEVARAANASVSKLGDSSAEIGKVIKVITGIAEQTNLLALNATIEAARAGEAGKGFAVVANEVKELAKETAKATEEIGQKIRAIQTDTRGAVNAIKQIGEVIDQVNDISSTIAGAVEEQTATTNEMGRNVAEAAKGSAEIAQNITGVAQAAGSTTEGADNAQKAASELARMAAELQQLVAQFRCEQADSNGAPGHHTEAAQHTNRLQNGRAARTAGAGGW
ncbi:MAG TPA: methyl-accepting chemotaxis protein [Gemmataceae bacterium]|nr:methyl-accepting chemotaxis protein [Gemmataceae bacterium]